MDPTLKTIVDGVKGVTEEGLPASSPLKDVGFTGMPATGADAVDSTLPVQQSVSGQYQKHTTVIATLHMSDACTIFDLPPCS